MTKRTLVYFSVDAKQLPFAIVALSVLKELTSSNKYGLIFTGKLNKTDRQLVKENFDLYYEAEELNNVLIDSHISAAAYLRYDVFSIWKNFDAYLYMDADTLAINSIDIIFEQYKHCSLCMVREHSLIKLPIQRKFQFTNYYNTGVILMKSSFLKQFNFQDFLAFHNENINLIKFHDQCTFNAYLFNKGMDVYDLNTKYNYLSKNFLRSHDKVDPVIIHFNALLGKPWQFFCIHPMRNVWRRWSQKVFSKSIWELGSLLNFRGILKNVLYQD